MAANHGQRSEPTNDSSYCAHGKKMHIRTRPQLTERKIFQRTEILYRMAFVTKIFGKRLPAFEQLRTHCRHLLKNRRTLLKTRKETQQIFGTIKKDGDRFGQY